MNPFIYLVHLVQFAFRKNPLLYVSLVLSTGTVFVEMLAVASLYPLLLLTSGQALEPNNWILRIMDLLEWPPQVSLFMLVFFFFSATRIIITTWNNSLSDRLGRRVMAQMSSKAFSLILSQHSMLEIEKKSIGYFITLAGDETFRASMLVIQFTQMVTMLFLTLAYYAAILLYSPLSGMAITLFLGAMLPVVYLVGAKEERLGKRQIRLSNTINSIFLDALNSLRSVKAFCAEDYISEQYSRGVYQYTYVLFLIDFFKILLKMIPPLLLIFLGVILVLGEKQSLNNGSIDLVWLTTMLILLQRFFPSLGHCAQMGLNLFSEAKAGTDVTQSLKEQPVEQNEKEPCPEPVTSIKIHALGFSYNNKDWVLKDFHATFEQGKSYLIQGTSGVGKSTLFDVLLKLYPIQTGKIEVNDVPIQQIADRSLRKKILILGQKTTILNDSISNNITYGWDASEQELRSVCLLACIDADIQEMPAGYDTLLNYQGSNLSGGQCQRIGIARALLRQPDVLILDESTNALDLQTRIQVIHNILNAYRDKIVIFVSHDPEIAKLVDVTLELKKPE
ncbi:ABC transporter ATP-binding protein [Deltaproteobacteria bacterium TL4]